MVKVLIVDDSAFMRKVITDILNEHKDIQVIGTASNGKDAIEKIKVLKPDVITLDVEMPVMNGLTALQIIMESTPLPVVMLSSTTQEGAENTILAMQSGAVDFIAKPNGAISLDLHKIKAEITEKVLLASRANIRGFSKKIAIPTPKEYSTIEKEPQKTNIPSRLSHVSSGKKKIVCIGTSTGGPRALQYVLTQLPANLQAPIVIVQHMPKGFTQSLAVRLNSLSKIEVKEAQHGDVLKNGVAYIAPGGCHMKVTSSGGTLSIQLDNSLPRNSHRPSVDVMFESVLETTDYEKVVVIMTGMGSDGTEGAVKLKKQGKSVVIAESEETSVVYGMPKAVVNAGVVDEIINVEKIADAIVKYAHS